MKIAIPLYGSRVAPRALIVPQVLLVRIEDFHLVSKKILDVKDMTEDERISFLLSKNIDILICGGIDENKIHELNSFGIEVIYNVAGQVGDVLNDFIKGKVTSGYGLTYIPVNDSEKPAIFLDDEKKLKADTDTPNDLLIIDCVRCVDRVCLKGQSCFGFQEDSFPNRHPEKVIQSAEVSTDIAMETERKLCRIAEFVYYCIGMNYQKVGLAFCVDLFEESEIFTRLLRRFFDVYPLCCKLGGIAENGSDLPKGPMGVVCNPIGQANAFNRLKTDINVIMGLCVGCDILFTQASDGPVTTLFVKDKMVANNPIGVLYSKYQLRKLIDEI